MAEENGQQVAETQATTETPSPYAGLKNLGRHDDPPETPAQPTPATPEPTPQAAKPASEAEPETPEPKGHDFDKGLGKTQQRVAALEKTVSDGFSKLEQLMAKFQQAPTAANQAAVEKQAEKQRRLLEGDENDLARTGDVNKAFQSLEERVEQLAKRYEQTDQAAAQMQAKEALQTAQNRFLGEYPGLTGQDFNEGLQTAIRTAQESYPDFAAWPMSAKDAYLSNQLREFGNGRKAAKGAPATETDAPAPSTPAPPPKTTKGTTNVLKGASGRSAPSPGDAPITSREELNNALRGKTLSRVPD